MDKLLSILIIAIAVQQSTQDVTEITGSVGKSVTLTCDLPRSNPPNIKWEDEVFNWNVDPEPIYNSNNDPKLRTDHENSADFSVDDDYSLIISNLKLEPLNDDDVSDSGLYRCISVDDEGMTHKKEYELKLAEMPKCDSKKNSFEDGDDIKMDCMLKFQGSGVPDLGWYIGKEKLDSKESPNFNSLLQELNMKADGPKHDGKMFTCKVMFGSLEDECVEAVTVTYGTKNVKIVKPQENYKANDVITCSADGNPKPSVQLESDAFETIAAESMVRYTIPKSLEGQEVTIKCTGSNEYKGQTYTEMDELTFNVIAPTTTTTTTTPKPKPAEGDKDRVSTNTDAPPIDKGKGDGEDPGASSGENNNGSGKPGDNTGENTDGNDNGNIVPIVAGIIIGVLVVVIIIIAVICIKRKKSKENKGSKPVPRKDDEVKYSPVDGKVAV